MRAAGQDEQSMDWFNSWRESVVPEDHIFTPSDERAESPPCPVLGGTTARSERRTPSCRTSLTAELLPQRKDTYRLSVMERNFSGASGDEATEALNVLDSDRQRLAQRVRIPWPLMAAFGALSAWAVSTAATTEPGANYDPPSTSWLALIGILVVAHLVQRETGIRFRSMGAGATWAMLGTIMGSLLMFSVSLGLVAANLRWAVIIPSLAAFALTTGLAMVAYRSAVEKLRGE